MTGLHPADWTALVVYLICITTLGVWTSRQVKSSGDFFMPRRFGKAMMITFAFGTGTSSDQAVTVASRTMTNGLSAIWWQWLWLPATPFYWIIAPIMRRMRAITTADVYKLRYDQSVALLFALVGILSLAAKIGLLLKGSGAMIDSCTGGYINANLAIAITTVLFVTYGIAGGLGAAIVTDFFQGILTVLFSFALLPFVLYATGGMSGVRETIAGHNPEMLSLVVPGRIGYFFVIMYSLQALIGIVAFPFIMGVCSAGRTEMDGRVGFMVGNIVKRICTVAWSLTSLAAVAWYLNSGVDLATVKPDHLYGNVARSFLPSILPGLLGIFLACLLASIMSSCDAIMISSSALFTENVYRPLAPDQPDHHYISVGRFASLIVVAGGVAFAYWVPGVVEALDFWFKISPMMGIAFWMGLIWRRATAPGAWAATITGFVVWWLTTRPEFVAQIAKLPFADKLGMIWQETGGAAQIYEPWVILLYTGSAVMAGLVVSLLTPPVPHDRLQTFYDLSRTPIEEGEIVTKPCTMPVGVSAPPRRMLVTALGLEIPMPSLNSWLGFSAGWVAVAILVWSFNWIVVSAG
jgi:Na+/proline symporter